MWSFPLVAADDVDLVGWLAGTQATYLNMVCSEVQKYCGWHVAPSIPVVNKRFWIMRGGRVMLGATHVTAVDSVTVNGQTLVLDEDYEWDSPKGWLRINPQSLSGMFNPGGPCAYIDLTAGYPETPPDVKAVIFEVVATAMELPASNATEITTMQYKLTLNTDIGVMLSKDQKERLSGYKINKFGGLVRP